MTWIKDLICWGFTCQILFQVIYFFSPLSHLVHAPCRPHTHHLAYFLLLNPSTHLQGLLVPVSALGFVIAGLWYSSLPNSTNCHSGCSSFSIAALKCLTRTLRSCGSWRIFSACQFMMKVDLMALMSCTPNLSAVKMTLMVVNIWRPQSASTFPLLRGSRLCHGQTGPTHCVG